MARQYEDEKGEKIWEQNGQNGQQMVQFECTRHWNPFVSSNFGIGWIPLPHYWPSGVIRNVSPVWRWRRWKNWERNGLSGQQMVQFECTRHWNPFISSNFGVEWIPLPHYGPSGVIRNGSSVWRWKRWTNLTAKWAEWPANGPVWMHQALKSICFIQFWDRVNSTSPLLALWGNKKCLSSMKMKKVKKLRTKWAEWPANGPVWMHQALKSIYLIQFWGWVNSTSPLWALWGNKKWLLSMKMKKVNKFDSKMGWMASKWSSLNAPGIEIYLFHPMGSSHPTARLDISTRVCILIRHKVLLKGISLLFFCLTLI